MYVMSYSTIGRQIHGVGGMNLELCGIRGKLPFTFLPSCVLQVLSLRSNEQMLRVDTMWRVAAGAIVTYNQALWHRPTMESPRYLVRSDDLLAYSKAPIARDNHCLP